jgi:Flp pilus assembly protein CpaB
MKPRSLLILAAGFGLVAVGLLQFDAYRSRGATVQIFRATRLVEPPATLKGAIEVAVIPASAFAGMSSQVPTVELQQWVSATPIVRRVRPGETITFDVLQRSADGGLPIGAGMRAIGLDIEAAQAVGYLVRPGDHVDVLATVPDAEIVVSKHVLQAKRVLAVDQQYRLEDSAFLQNRTYRTVTLEVTPAEAELIEAYRGLVRSGFSLALRPRGELDLVKTPTFPITELAKRQ